MKQNEKRFCIFFLVLLIFLNFLNYSFAFNPEARLNYIDNNKTEFSLCPPDYLCFGSSMPLSGPESFLGKEFSFGIRLAFKEANNKGGIRGQKLKLIVLDDGYEPLRAYKNIEKLAKNSEILAIVGNVGTPTTVASFPLAEKYKILFFAPFTGSEFLRKVNSIYIINFRASYKDEIKTLYRIFFSEDFSHSLIKGFKLNRIAFLIQNDAFGETIFQSVYDLTHSTKEILFFRYKRNTANVYNTFSQIMKLNGYIKGIIFASTYQPAQALVDLLKREQFKIVFMALSFIGINPLVTFSKNSSSEFIVTYPLPPYWDKNLPLVKDYLKSLKTYAPNHPPSFVSFEGYIIAKILIKALKKWKGPIDRKSLIKALYSLKNFDIGLGMPLFLNETHRNISHRVWLYLIKRGKIKEISLEEARKYVEDFFR